MLFQGIVLTARWSLPHCLSLNSFDRHEMKILIVAFHFPLWNIIGAVRVGELAGYSIAEDTACA
jgi:hypothetical protein